MGFLIDTNLWIAIERGQISAADIHSFTGPSPVYLSPVNIAEICHGVELMTNTAQRRRAIEMLRRLRRKPLLRITGETAEIFGAISARLSKTGRGHDFRVQDVWIASQAIQRGFTLLTANEKDFRDIPHLKLLAVKLA